MFQPTNFYTCKNGTWELLTELDGWRKPSATATKIVKGHGWVGVTVKGEVNRTQGGSWETFELTYGGEVIQEIGWLSAAIPISRRETVSTELYDYIEHAKEDTGTFEFRAGTASTTGASSAGVQVALSNLTVSLTPGSHTGGSSSRTMSPSTYTVEFKKSPNDAQEGASCGTIITLPPGGGSGSTPPTDNTPNCSDCTSHCSSPCSCSTSGTCNGTVTDNTPNCPDCTSHCSSPCSCSTSGTCNGTVSYHACGEHETSVSGDHSLQASCSSTDSNGNYCTVTSFYACDGHSHTYPAPPPSTPTTVACGGASYTGCSGASSRTEHRVPSCGNCGNSYWTCSQWASRHTISYTCQRTGCGASLTRCQNGPGRCVNGGYHWLDY